MVRKVLAVGLIATGATASFGCGEPIVGEWKTDHKINCDRRGKMTIADDLDGKGSIPFTDCSDCTFKVKVKDADSDDADYEIKVTMTSQCTFPGPAVDAVFECGLEESDTILNCGRFYYWKLQEE